MAQPVQPPTDTPSSYIDPTFSLLNSTCLDLLMIELVPMAYRITADLASRVPADFIQDGLVVKGLPGLLTLLHDRHFDDRECIAWIFTDDDLPGRPIDALRENRGSEVKRRAQVLGY